MLTNILKSMTPEVIAEAIRANPIAVQMALNKFESYQAFGSALSNEQQVRISNNMNRLGDFFKSAQGKNAVSNLADEFINFVK